MGGGEIPAHRRKRCVVFLALLHRLLGEEECVEGEETPGGARRAPPRVLTATEELWKQLRRAASSWRREDNVSTDLFLPFFSSLLHNDLTVRTATTTSRSIASGLSS
jgi:hypothetical protein